MLRPQPCVLFAQSFLHPRLAEYVDEVRFTEPVIICACEFLELQTSSICPTLSLSGVSFPQSFALEIFVRSGGEARFKRLCPAFLYSPSASSVLEVQAVVTDHLVIRGSYRSLSLVVYGNSAKDLGQFNADHDIESTLSDLLLPAEAVLKAEDLPEALQIETGNLSKVFPPLKNLQLVYRDPEQSVAMQQLLTLAVDMIKSISDHVTTKRVFDVLLCGASAVLSELGIESGFPQWPTLTKTAAQSQKKVKDALKQARDDIQVINAQMHKSTLDNESSAVGKESLIMEVILDWIEKSFQLSMPSDMSVEEHLIGGLAAVQILCTDAHWCLQFVMAGGVHLLMNVLQCTSAESSATALLVLGAVKCACQHAFACEALLGWWPPKTTSTDAKSRASVGYCVILKLLLQTKRHNVAQLASQVLHCLHAYEVVSEFQCEVEPLLQTSSINNTDVNFQPVSDRTLKRVNLALKRLVSLLNAKDFPQDWSPAQMAHWLIMDGDDNAFTLPPNAIFSWITASKYSFALKDLNSHILSVLQERCFIPMLVALLSAPCMRSALGKLKDSSLEFIGNVEALIMALISSRSGLLFLASDQEAAAALVSGLVGIQELQGSNSINLRHACSLMSAGFLCNAQDVGCMLHTSLSVIGTIDRLLATSRHSESFLWILWELSVFSRSETGRQALLAIAYFPEVFAVIVEALQPGSQSLTADAKEGWALKRAILHSAAEVVQVVLMDPISSSLAAWVPHALSLQKALQYCSPTTIDIAVGSHALASGSKDALCAHLLDWVDAAVVFHKKGPVGLLRYAATLVAGNVTPIAGGLSTADPVEPENTITEAAGSTDFPSVDALLGRGIILGASAGTILPDTAVTQLTVSMRIMSAISCHPGIAAVFYGEGAMAILYILVEYGAGFFQTSTSDYDFIVEEDGEGDGITEMIVEQRREQSLLGLLLPSLLLLLNLLKRLQLTGEEYRNTRLVEILLQLHQCVCARLASRVTVPPQAGGMLVLASVSRLLASILACWPVFNWTPSFFPKLLGQNTFTLVQTSNLLPVEPTEAISVLCLLGDLLPEESPQVCSSEIFATDILRSLAVRTLLGVKSMKVVGWHCQPPHSQKLIQSVGLHLDHISSMVFHLACTTSAILQSLLIKLTVRLACQSEDYAATLVYPVLAFVRENTPPGDSVSESEIFRVERFLELVKELAKHPPMKRVLLREGIVQVLLQAINGKSNQFKTEALVLSSDRPSSILRWCPHVLRALVEICNPEVSMSPGSPVKRRLVEDCPSFVDYCSIAASVYNFCVFVPLGEELQIAVETMGMIVSHQLGRAAFASIARSSRESSSLSFSFRKEASSADGIGSELQDTKSHIPEDSSISFVPFCRRLYMDLTENVESVIIVSIIEHFCHAAIQLCAAGRSACGVGALQMLFEMDKMETKEILTSIVSHLENRGEDIVDTNCRDLMKVCCQKAQKTVTILLRLLENLPAIMFLEKKVKVVVDGLHSVLPSKDEHASVHRHWKILPPFFCGANEEEDAKLNTRPLETMDAGLDESMRDKFTWECAAVLPDKPSMAGLPAKRKSGGNADGGSKKHRVEGGGNGQAAETASSVNGTLAGRVTGTVSSASASTRRDTFRQRKPNTSRPPSMHVDDYVARERGNETTVVSGSISQRNVSGGGRPPSIHVDEFMARQRERQQTAGAIAGVDSQAVIVAPQQSQTQQVKTDGASNAGKVFRPSLPEDDELQDVEIEIEGLTETDDILTLSVAGELVVPRGDESIVSLQKKAEIQLVTTKFLADERVEASASVSMSDIQKEADASKLMHLDTVSLKQPLHGEGNEDRSLEITLSESFPSASQSLKIQAPLEMESVSSLMLPLQMREPSKVPLGTHISQNITEHRPTTPQDASMINLSLHRTHVQFPVAPPFPPPLPPPPPIPAGVIPEKYETSSGMEQHHFSYHRGLAESLVNAATAAAPPPPPPGPWQPVEPALRRMDPPHGAPLNPLTFKTLGSGHPSISASVGAGTMVLQAPLPPWSGVALTTEETAGSGRPPPPLPPTPPPFSSTQASVLQVPSLTPNIMPHSPALYAHNIGRSFSESRPIYTSPSGVDMPSIDKRFSVFSPSMLGQSSVPQSPALPAAFLPPLPPGRPHSSPSLLVSASPGQQQQHLHQSQQVFQPSPPAQPPEQTDAVAQPQQTHFQQQIHAQRPQQQESGKLLQQILASPDAIQDLLKDQNKLQNLLEQHPKLISLLQEKMGQN